MHRPGSPPCSRHLTQHAAVLAVAICLAAMTLVGSILPSEPLGNLVGLLRGLPPGVP